MGANRWLFGGALLCLVAACRTLAGAAEPAVPLSLSESVAEALKRSVIVHSAQEGVRAAEAERRAAFTGFLPRFSTTYSYTRLNDDPTVRSQGASVVIPPGIPVTIPPTTYQAGTKDNYNWALEARQPLFAGGGIQANYEASRLSADVAGLEAAAAVQDIVRDVKVAYFNILKAMRMRDVARQSLEQVTAHRDTAQGFFDAGLIPLNDLLTAEVELSNGRQFLTRAENGLEMAKSRFNMVLRRELDVPVLVEDLLNEQPYGRTLAECSDVARENRPEILSARLRVEQARSLVKLSKSEFYPRVNLVGNYARYGDTPAMQGSLYKDRETWYVMGVADWAFWEWGRTKNRVEASRNRENQAADLLDQVRDQIGLEVKNAWLLLREAEEQVRVSKQAVGQAEENFRVNTERYREQVGTATEVVDAQTLLTRARADYYNALGDVGIGRAVLERAMGLPWTGI